MSTTTEAALGNQPERGHSGCIQNQRCFYEGSKKESYCSEDTICIRDLEVRENKIYNYRPYNGEGRSYPARAAGAKARIEKREAEKQAEQEPTEPSEEVA